MSRPKYGFKFQGVVSCANKYIDVGDIHDLILCDLIVLENSGIFLQQLEVRTMDKQINKVKKDVQKGEKKKAMKDIKTLQKMDKKFDKKLDKAKIKH